MNTRNLIVLAAGGLLIWAFAIYGLISLIHTLSQ